MRLASLTLIIILSIIILYTFYRRSQLKKAKATQLKNLYQRKQQTEELIHQTEHIHRQYILHTHQTISQIETLPLENLSDTELETIKKELLSAQASLTELEQKRVDERTHLEQQLLIIEEEINQQSL